MQAECWHSVISPNCYGGSWCSFDLQFSQRINAWHVAEICIGPAWFPGGILWARHLFIPKDVTDDV